MDSQEPAGHAAGTRVGRKAAKMRRYRKNVRSDPERYEKMKDKDRERKRREREQKKKAMRGDKRKTELEREKKRLQQQAYRQKIKDKRETALADARKRSSDNDKVVAAEKKTEELKKQKAVLRTQKWRLRVKLNKAKAEKTASSFKSKWSQYSAVRKVKNMLPKTPTKKAEIVEYLAESPTTSSILDKRNSLLSPKMKKKFQLGSAMVESMQECISEIKSKGTQKTEKKKAYKTLSYAILKNAKKFRVKRTLATQLKVRRYTHYKSKAGGDWWKAEKRKLRKDRISDSVRSKVKEFFLSPEVSREVPGKRDVVTLKSNGEKETVQKHIMIMTLQEAYDLFKTKNQNEKIGLTAFKKLKPGQVRYVSETNRRSCLCQICCNVALKIEAMNTFISKEPSLKEKYDKTSKKEVSDLTLCPYTDLPANACLEQECGRCGVSNLLEHYKEVAELSQTEKKEITWHKWEFLTC